MGPQYCSWTFASQVDAVRASVSCPVLAGPLFQLFSSLTASYKPLATLLEGFLWLQVHDPACRLEVSVNQCLQKQPSTVIQWKMSDKFPKPHLSGGATLRHVMQSLPRVPRGLSPSCPHQEFCSFAHPLIGFLSFLVSFSTCLPVVPGIVPQINYLHSHPYLRVYWGNPY